MYKADIFSAPFLFPSLSEPVQFTRILAKRTGRVPIQPAKFRDKSGEAVNTMQEIFKQLQRMTIKVPKTRRC